MDFDLAVLAGVISSIVFVGSVLPMLIKAVRTRDLASYSLGNLLLANLGNVVHSVYVFSLPTGPIWALHGFYLLTSAFMLVMYLRHREPRPREGLGHDVSSDVLRTDGRVGSGSEDAGRAAAGRPEGDLQAVGALR
ncbi:MULTISPECIES: hypothetical protein [Micrococcaceae]|uniref:hypothetical protein n=1 Tax=Micrococcaceae TaxID=1268 RepID=UPI00181A005B|nr:MULTISPECIES: hypothetical protein [Micrococcaceae]MBB5749071.1 uncharacterized protein with PQ loop repeat [Micrococcus sp. TA1]HRO94172.1 hypothetical protein [Citricoccus sp.]